MLSKASIWFILFTPKYSHSFPSLLTEKGSADVNSRGWAKWPKHGLEHQLRETIKRRKQKWKLKFSCLCRRKTKMEFGIPFSKVVGKWKTKIEVWISFSEIAGKQKTQMEFRISFSNVVGKRLALGYTHYAPSDWPKIMITLQSRAYNKNKCNLISRSDGGADLLIWSLNIHVDYSFAIRYLICRMLGPLIKISLKRGKNCTRKHTRVSLELLKL